VDVTQAMLAGCDWVATTRLVGDRPGPRPTEPLHSHRAAQPHKHAPGHDEGTYETPKGTADPFFGKPIRSGDHPESTNPPHSPRLTYGCSCATHALSKPTLHTPVPARLESAAPRLQSRPAVSEPPNRNRGPA
jgi:hypothetical protein